MYLRVLLSVVLVDDVVVPSCITLRIADEGTTLTPVSLMSSSSSSQKHGPPDPEFRWHEKEVLAVVQPMKMFGRKRCLYGFEVNLRVRGRVVGGFPDIHIGFALKSTIIVNIICAAVEFNRCVTKPIGGGGRLGGVYSIGEMY